MEFVWNEIQAEDIREQTAAAMQSTVDDMQAQAEEFMAEATALEAEATALEAQAAQLVALPTPKRIDSDGDEVKCTDTMESRRAQIESLRQQAATKRQRVADLNTVAQKLQKAASILNQAIHNTNGLFQRLFELAQRTDRRAALEMQGIKGKISAYINKIEALRDSFSIFTGLTDWSFVEAHNNMGPFNHFGAMPNTPDARLAIFAQAIDAGLVTLAANSSALQPGQWLDYAEILRRNIGNTSGVHLTDANLAYLATVFGRLYSPSDIGKFLSLMTFEVSTNGKLVIDTNNNRANNSFFKFCTERSSRIAGHLWNNINSTLDTQIRRLNNNIYFRNLDEGRQQAQTNFALLSHLTGIFSNGHPAGNYLLMGTNDSPIRVTPRDEGGFHATFNFAVHRPMDDMQDIIWVSPISAPQLNPTDPNAAHLSPALIDRRVSVTESLIDLELTLSTLSQERFILNNQFNIAKSLTTQIAGSGLTNLTENLIRSISADVAGATGIVIGTLSDASSARDVLADHELTIYYGRLSTFFERLALEGNIITDMWVNHETGDMFIPHMSCPGPQPL